MSELQEMVDQMTQESNEENAPFKEAHGRVDFREGKQKKGSNGLQFLDGVEVDEEELRAAGNDSDVERDENEPDEQAEDVGDDPHPPAVNTEENHDWMTKDPSRPPVRNKTTTSMVFFSETQTRCR